MQAFVDWRVDWPNDATTAGFEHCDVTTDPFEISSLDATRAAARQAVLRAHLALLRNCGAPGRLRCLDAERIQERIFHGAFD
ncbi:MAG: hypothetical protein ABIW82_18700 [Dokdonella sp.]